MLTFACFLNIFVCICKIVHIATMDHNNVSVSLTNLLKKVYFI
jgi:hypothetical protein